MLELFEKNDSKGIFPHDSIYKSLDIIKYNTSDLINYYSDTEYPVKRPNMFISLINELGIDPYMDIDDLDLQLAAKAAYISRLFDIITPGNNGNVKLGNIIPKTTEVFLYTQYDVEIDETTYKHLSPIRIKYSTIDTLVFEHPYKYPAKLSDFIVYEIDPILLGKQYYYWMRDRLKNKESIDASIFLFQIPFLNILHDLIGHGWFNTIVSGNINTYYCKKIYLNKNVSTFKHDIEVIRKSIRNSIITVLNIFNTNNLYIYPGNTLYEYNNNLWLKQNVWVKDYTYAVVLSEWIDILNKRSKQLTAKLYRTWLPSLYKIKDEKLFNQYLPMDIGYKGLKSVDKLINFIKEY